MRFLFSVGIIGLIGCGNESQVDPISDPTGDAGTEDVSLSGEADLIEVSQGEEPAAFAQLDVVEGMLEVVVEPAEMLMGMDPSDADYDNFHVPHTVDLTNEWAITETEVTHDQFEALMGYDPAELWLPPGSEGSCGDCPVQSVTWHEAQAYGNALSRAAGLEECFTCEGDTLDIRCEPIVDPYECSGFRLPTEAEWEHAARGGETFIYPGSEDIDDIAYWRENSGDRAYPVASLAPNGFGLYDMGGNIRERVYDAYHAYDGEVEINPVVMPVLDGDELFAERGGSFACERAEIRWNRRNLVWDYDRDIHTGFRVARILK
jgi:formylglycine-generating enzyme required for sulfatase activity